MIQPYWCIETSSKTTVTHCPVKCDHSTQNWDVWPIPDRMMILDDPTILMYRNIIKNNSNHQPLKVWPQHPKLGRMTHIPDTMMILYDPTKLMYKNIIKNNINHQPLKAWPEPPKLARITHIPYRMMVLDDPTILMYRNIIKKQQ